MTMVLNLTRVRNIGIRVDLGENDSFKKHTGILEDNQVKVCGRQMNGEVWAKDKDLEITELELPKSEKWW